MALAEITKIDRYSGDIIWRMGGKNNQFTFVNESEEFAPLYFMWQHDVRRLSTGHITLFDVGEINVRPWSRVVEYELNESNKTATIVWGVPSSAGHLCWQYGKCPAAVHWQHLNRLGHGFHESDNVARHDCSDRSGSRR